MSSVLGGLEGLATRSAGEAIAFGLGLALGAALAPEATQLAQDVWKSNPSKAVDPGTAAQVVAENVEQLGWGQAEANQHGIDNDRFHAILGEVLNAPGFGELVAMLRRGTIEPDDFLHGLRKAKLENRWDTPLEELRHERLSPQVLATAAQRSVVPNDGLLPVTFDHAGATVTPMPMADIDTLKEAAASGYDRERLAALARIVGLPPAPGELLQLLNRREINEADFRMGISEGNTRNEWADKLMALRRRLLTPHEYVEANVRAWITPEAMRAGAALSGMTAADTDLLHKIIGRPISFRQVFIGLRRGGEYDGPTSEIAAPFLKSLQESNIRPEWYSLAWAQRYSYPSMFVLRALATDGAITRDEFHSILLFQGTEPTLATKIADHYTTGGAAKPDPHVTKAETHLWTTLHGSYVAYEVDEQDARGDLAALAVPEAAQTRVLALWERERELRRKRLTAAQVKKAYKTAAENPATGAKWTYDDAVSALLSLGYSHDDALTFLEIT